MNINLARKLDINFGIPACFILTLFDRIKKPFIKTSKYAILPKRILFLGISELGSAILSYPAIKIAHENYPRAELFFCIFKEKSEAVKMLGLIREENIFTLRSDNFWFLFIDSVKSIVWMRSRNIDTIIDIELFSRFSAILSYLSGAKQRSGFNRHKFEGLYRGNLHTHNVIFNTYLHISKNFISLVESLKNAPGQVPSFKGSLEDVKTCLPRIMGGKEKKDAIFGKLHKSAAALSGSKVVVLNPELNSRLPLRCWPKENYEKLIRKLLVIPDIFVIAVCVDYTKSSFNISSERYIDLIGKTTIKELVDLFSISDLFISHDSGAVHLASLTDVNIISIFGPETPILYHSLSEKKEVIYLNLACSPCFSPYNYRKSLCKDNRCLKLITVEEVFNRAVKYL